MRRVQLDAVKSVRLRTDDPFDKRLDDGVDFFNCQRWNELLFDTASASLKAPCSGCQVRAVR